MRPVGILGGMGPEATILMMQKCMGHVTRTATGPLDDADHIPLIVHQNPQVPSRIARLIEGRGPDPAPVLAQMARDLAAAGAQALAMPCNTAHHYAPAIRAATDLPFLDMIAATADHLTAMGARRPGMLASPATRMAGVFDEAFRAGGLRPVWLADEAPLLGLVSLMGPAIAMGNRVVLVASEAFPLAATDLYQILDTSDVPGGVVNILTGSHAELAPTLAAHADVDALWCFSSSPLSEVVEAASAGNLKRTWVNDGQARDWMGAAGEGRAFLEQATEIKTIWVPYGA
ncbi:MAG: amino acid racemase [Alphaproteobacteria bacterium]